MKKTYSHPYIQNYKRVVDSIMNEVSVPKYGGDSTDEQCSKKNFFDGEFEEVEKAKQ